MKVATLAPRPAGSRLRRPDQASIAQFNATGDPPCSFKFVPVTAAGSSVGLGSIAIDGDGTDGAIGLHVVAFPRSVASDTTGLFKWTAEVVLPAGDRLLGSGSLAVSDSSEVVITIADLRPA